MVTDGTGEGPGMSRAGGPQPPGRVAGARLGKLWSAEIAPGVFRLGTPFVGCYAVEENGAYTFIDTGLPRYWEQMTGFLTSRNALLPAVKAVVLTHWHDDHRGNAERLRTQAHAEVLVHLDDLAAAMRRGKPPRFPLWNPRVLHYFAHVLANGVARVPPVVRASGFADGEVLDIPGRLRVIHAPGHTPGNAAVSLEDRGVLVVGDALATIDLVTGKAGPRLLPRFTNDNHDLALASLQRIESVPAHWVLPGHGLPWQGSPRQAVKLARQAEARNR